MHTASASAPGRVNLIGEHLDYNGGRCLPIALPMRTTATVGRRGGRAPESAYVRGVLWALGVDETLDVTLSSDVPIGVGLSSSAALECSVALAVDAVLDLGLSAAELAAACVRAETEYVGASTGGLDQAASLFCREGQALLIDFASTSRTPVPFRPEEAGLALVVVDTRVSHAHAGGEYGDRRSECDQAARLLGVRHLVDATPDGSLPELLQRRLRHVLTEQRRVDSFVEAASTEDWGRAGELMTASHASLRDDFEVSCAQLDLAVDTALEHGALGARMTGGGFGGSAIALVPHEQVEPASRAISEAFAGNGWEAPTTFVVEASRGASVDAAT